MTKRKSFLLALLTMLCPVLSSAQVTAATCNKSDVSKAWASVTSLTTTFTIPPGNCSWTSRLSLKVPSRSALLTIQGSTTISANCAAPPTYTSACTATDNTVIVDNCSGGCSPLLSVTTATANSLFRVTGITFKGGSGGPEYNGQLEIGGYSQSVRVDHNHFNTTTYTSGTGTLGVETSGWVQGVIDHNVFDLGTSANQGTSNGFHVSMPNYGNDPNGFGDTSWSSVTGFGSANFVFAENNTFNYGYVDDCSTGGRYVLRYNVIMQASSQTHPTGGSGRFRGCRATEVYKNIFNVHNGVPQTLHRLNSGAALVWGNTSPSTNGQSYGYRSVLYLNSFRRDNGTYRQTATPNGWGYCGTSFSGAGSNWDQNANSSTGYHCFDQPGMGQGDLLVGGFTADGSGTNNVRNRATGCLSNQTCVWPRQAIEPVYEWLDAWVGVYGGDAVYVIDPDGTSSFVANSDYFSSSHPGSGSDCKGFTGATGVGCGLLSARPATCTPKVAYWSTDTNTLYQCSPANNWTAYYTPYIYPHPLTRNQSSESLPAAPTSLAATVN